MSEQTFADKLNALVSLEVSRGTIRNPEAMSDLLEKLASALGFTAALAAAGRFRAKHVLETDPRMDTGSREENANQNHRASLLIVVMIMVMMIMIMPVIVVMLVIVAVVIACL